MVFPTVAARTGPSGTTCCAITASRKLLLTGKCCLPTTWATYPEMLPRDPGFIMPGIAALLQQLRLLDAPVGLLTGNVRAGARLKLGHFDLFHHFAFGGFGDDHHHRDDVAREALAVVHRQFNGSVVADEIWVIGDTPLDVACARAIGARAVAVGTGWHSMEELAASKPDVLLADLSDPAPLLGKG